MKTNASGLTLIKKWEGLRLDAYTCPAGVWTIGYGHTSAAGPPAVSKGMRITEAEAESVLVRDLGRYEAAVSKAITRQATANQFSAMVSLCFNIGPGAFAGSTLVKRFNAGDEPGAADAFLMWRKAGGKVLPGLEARRAAERKLFLAAGAPEKPAEAVPPPPATPAAPKPETPAEPLPESRGGGIAKLVLGAVAALIAALAAWIMKG